MHAKDKPELEVLDPDTTNALLVAEERAAAGQLALELMHEIKNPIETLGHLTYLAAEEAEETEAVRHYMQLAEEQMVTLRHIITNTLGFANSSRVLRSVDLQVLAEAGVRIHQRALNAKGIHLVKDLPGGITARIHMGEMLQVVSNLIVNALEALPADGKLRLRVKRLREEVHITVADNGEGIPSELLDRIFEPYFTTKEERGTGLGLALSRRIVDRHKGRIRIRSSVRPGSSGTVFRISLPA